MQNDLFTALAKPAAAAPDAPLAEKIRPTVLAEIAGHKKLLAPGSALRTMIDNDSYTSFILWGPPGSGKTTIARMIERNTALDFHSFSAVFSKIADVKKLMQDLQQRHAHSNRTNLVFIDEIHRFRIPLLRLSRR